MAKLICFKDHIPVKGVFAARKGAHFAYLEITSQQRAFFRPGECRGEHQGTTGRTLVRNLSSARRTRSPPVLWLLFWECDYGNMQNSYWGKQSPPSENAMSPRFWLQFLIIILHFELGTKQQYLCCICFWRFLAMDHLTTTLRWSYLRWDNKATTMIKKVVKRDLRCKELRRPCHLSTQAWQTCAIANHAIIPSCSICWALFIVHAHQQVDQMAWATFTSQVEISKLHLIPPEWLCVVILKNVFDHPVFLRHINNFFTCKERFQVWHPCRGIHNQLG